MSDRILVTGAAGFVGQHLVSELADRGHEVVALDIERDPPSSFPNRIRDDIEYLHGSIVNQNFIETTAIPSPNSYDRVFHLAAVVGVERYIDTGDPEYMVDVNVNGTKYILNELKGSNIRFVYTSTSEVYGKNPEMPWDETSNQVLGAPTAPRWSYSITKSLCEHMIHMLARADDQFSASVVRPFNLYGPFQREQFVISKFIEQILDGDAPTIYDDGSQSRCFTYIDDFIDGIIRASNHDHDKSEVYNLGSTEETSIRNLATEILDIAGASDRPLEFVSRSDLHGEEFEDPDRRVPDVSKAAEQLNWEPETPLRDGLEMTYQWMKNR